MFTKAYTKLSEKDWEHAPKTTNPVESINRQSVHQKGSSLHTLMENFYLEDRTYAAKVSEMETNVSQSYSNNEEARRKNKNDRKRKRSKLTRSTHEDDNVPPNKRRNVESRSNNKKNNRGRSLIGTRIAVEFQEESPAENKVLSI